MEKKCKHEFTVKSGDIVTFTGINYHVPGWMDEQPVVFIKPFLLYTEGHWEAELDDICINLCVDGKIQIFEDNSTERDINWSGKSSKSIKRAISRALKTNKKACSSVHNETFECDVEFYEELEDPKLPYDEDANPIVLNYKILKKTIV